MHILGICGSIRRDSYNRGLLRAAVALAPAGVVIDIADVGDLPLINEDIEQPSRPGPVRALRRRAFAADALLFALPEYNHAVSAPAKNAIDWLSRAEQADARDAPDGETRKHPFDGRPVATIGATLGLSGGARAQAQARQSLLALGGAIMPTPELFVGGAQHKFDGAGDLNDASTRDALAAFVAAFAAWTQKMGGR